MSPVVLDNAVTGVLGGIQAQQTETTVGDRGQGVALTWTQTGADQDLEAYGYSLRFAPAETDAPDSNVFDLSSVTRTGYGVGLYSNNLYGGLSGAGISQVFVLDSSTLGTLWINVVETILQDRGRSMQLTWSQSQDDKDLELFGYGIRFEEAEPFAMEVI